MYLVQSFAVWPPVKCEKLCAIYCYSVDWLSAQLYNEAILYVCVFQGRDFVTNTEAEAAVRQSYIDKSP